MSQYSFLTANQIRNLPVYLLIDCSTSMQGEPIQAVNDGLRMIHDELLNDPRTLETVQLCIIAFADQAGVLFPLGNVSDYQPQTVHANGQTAMGQAFQILSDSIDNDVHANTNQRRGDYRPIVFLLTDGQPTDEYNTGIQRLHNFSDNKKPLIIALACGPRADMNMLRKLTQIIFKMDQVNGDTIRQYFQWISGSITQAAGGLSFASGQSVNFNPPTDIPGIRYEPESPQE